MPTPAMTYQQFKTQYALSLDPQQEAAVQAAEGPVLLLAVPGSGKTTVLIARLGYLILCRGVAPESILTMTYTVAATREMQQRFAAVFGAELAARLEFRTINGVSARVIRCYEVLKGRTAFRLLSDEAQRTAILSELYRKATGEFAAESDIQSLKTQITYVKNMQPARDQIEKMQLEGSNVMFAPLYRAYCAALRAHGWMDYDDQMVYACQILRRCPEVLARMRRGWLCVDEAQDTSRIQHQIIRLLAGARPNLFMVGDEDQSIYGFRAAYPQALMEFDRAYPGARVLLMERNYRSTPQIVARAQAFIAQNADRRPKQMAAAQPDGPAVRAIPVRDRQAQYGYLAKVAEGCAGEEQPGVTAVLYRDNDSALPLLDLLARADTPYRCRQLECTFFTHPVIRDLTDILRLSADPSDAERFFRVYYKFGAGISKVQAQLAADEAAKTGRPVLDCLLGQESPTPWTRRQVKALRTHLQNMALDDAEKALWRVLNPMGYGEYLAQRGGDTAKLDILQALAAREPSPAQLLARLEELQAIARRGAAGPAPQAGRGFVLSTIHSSKGLEYDRVFLADVADGILPGCDLTDQSPAGRAALEEERRLLYVGMTRAKRELAVFVFQKEELRSSFAEQVFPQLAQRRQEEERSRREAQARRARTAARQSRAAATLTLDRGAAAQKSSGADAVIPPEFRPGCRVYHTAFGSGEVEKAKDGVLTIRLDQNGRTKRINCAAAVECGALWPE